MAQVARTAPNFLRGGIFSLVFRSATLSSYPSNTESYEEFEKFVGQLSDFVWGPPLLILLLARTFFSRSGFASSSDTSGRPLSSPCKDRMRGRAT